MFRAWHIWAEEVPVNQQRVAVTIGAIILAAFFVGPGLWAFFDSEGFYDSVATFEPYNEHFIHDVGAFQIGIGVALAVAAWRSSDALLAAFAGAAVGGAFHTVAHFIDSDLGGKDSDVFVFGVMTLVAGAGAWLRLQARPRWKFWG